MYRLENGVLTLKQASSNRLDAKEENEAFLLRIMGEGEMTYKGADLCILFLNEPLKQSEDHLTPNSESWMKAVYDSFSLRNLTDEELEILERYKTPAKIKGF